MHSNSDLRSTLNHLIQTCRDGQEGFLTAAENVQGVELKQLFNECSLQRAKFTGELQAAAHGLGDSNPENASSVAGTLHRGWINLKTAIGGRDQQAILAECERGEDSAVAEYQKTLAQEMPKDIREIVEHQHAAIVATHDRVKALRDA
ncbi:MAG: PA2169 family four-helix-bundle protein [Chthoniobacter sp.]|uniref:PA2169 family four-helix-bundle protein n=1 Tax=Chthoniobacter sp. TaxID=2510640 RepID=UPI0032ABB3C2